MALSIRLTQGNFATFPGSPNNYRNLTYGYKTIIECDTHNSTSSRFNVGDHYFKTSEGLVGAGTSLITMTPIAGAGSPAQSKVYDPEGITYSGVVRRYEGGGLLSFVNVPGNAATIDAMILAQLPTNSAARIKLDISAYAYNIPNNTVTASFFKTIHCMYSWNASGVITERLNTTNTSSDYNSDATNFPVTKAIVVTSANDVMLRCSRYSTSTNIESYYAIRAYILDTCEQHADINGTVEMGNNALGHGQGYY